MRRCRLAGATAAILGAAALLAGGVRAELPRRIGVSAACTYYVLDEDFFDFAELVYLSDGGYNRYYAGIRMRRIHDWAYIEW